MCLKIIFCKYTMSTHLKQEIIFSHLRENVCFIKMTTTPADDSINNSPVFSCRGHTCVLFYIVQLL